MRTLPLHAKAQANAKPNAGAGRGTTGGICMFMESSKLVQRMVGTSQACLKC